MSARILFHVQHLLGTGHLKRAAAVSSALAAAGFDVEIVSGGAPLADLAIGKARLVQLPPLRTADATFKTLLDANRQPINDTWKVARRAVLLERFAAFKPDVLITELFPFGRRLLEFELLPLLEAARTARPRPLILASLRDVLVAPSDPAKAVRAAERARDLYDRVLVHGDETFIDLPASFPAAHGLPNIVYTGYAVSPPAPEPPPGIGDGEIVVSAGGSAVGARLLETAIAARAGGAEPQRTWRLLLGGDLNPDIRARLAAAAGPKLIVEPARADFPNLLRRCHVSVSQGGYNTIMDIFAARARAVIVPIATAGETEQAQRAAALAQRGWAQVVAEGDLTPSSLAAAIEYAGRQDRPDIAALKRDGAASTVRLVQKLLAERGRAA